jgi:hypothetical protein
MATIAVFIALGGGAYAALTLPKNSVGSRQIKKGAVDSSKVKDRSLRAGDFKPGQLPAGARGLQGERGLTGPPGPDAKSFDATVSVGGSNVVIEAVNGLQVRGSCDASKVQVILHADPDSTRFTYSLYGNEDSVLQPDSGTSSLGVVFDGTGQAGFDAFAQNESVQKWTRIYAYGTKGTPCRIRGMVIPTS